MSYKIIDVEGIGDVYAAKLTEAGINTVEELTNKTPDEMMKVRNLGKKSLDEVLEKLKELGLHLRDSEE